MSSEFRTVPIGDLRESKQNPRHHFDKQGLEDLASSIKAHGVLTPILVRPNNGHFEIAAGHRRYRAAKAAGLAEIPATVRDLSDTELLEVLVIENLQREDVHPLEEAEGYRALIEKAGYDAEAIAAKVGKSASYVYQRLKLAELIPPAKKAFFDDAVTAGHAILLARLQPSDQAEALKIATDENRYRGTMSVRELSGWIAENIHLDLHSAPWKKDDATLLPAAGACTTCPKRTGFNELLFDDIAKKDTCTDRNCFQKKEEAFVARRIEDLAKGGKVLQVSTEYSFYGQPAKKLKHDGVIPASDYEQIEPGRKSCEKAAKALIVHGEDVGREIRICRAKDCKVHHVTGNSRGDERFKAAQRARERKAKAETRVRRAIAKHIVENGAGTLSRKALELLACSFYGDIWHENRKALLAIMDWTDEKKGGGRYVRPEAELAGKLGSLKTPAFHGFLAVLTAAKDLHVSSNAYGGGERGIKLEDAAKKKGGKK